MKRKPTKYQSAMVIVTRTIAKDKGLYKAFEANIAVAFQDECLKFKRDKHAKFNKKGRKRSGGSRYYLSQRDIAIISNRAAEYFLMLWLSDTNRKENTK